MERSGYSWDPCGSGAPRTRGATCGNNCEEMTLGPPQVLS